MSSHIKQLAELSTGNPAPSIAAASERKACRQAFGPFAALAAIVICLSFAWLAMTRHASAGYLPVTHQVVKDESLSEPYLFYPASYYPGVQDSSMAQLILLRPGEQSQDLVMTMQPAGGTITGRVMGGDSNDAVPLNGVLVGARSGMREILTRSEHDGRFVLRGVPAGRVRIRYCTDDTRTGEGRYLALYHPDAADSLQAATYDLDDGDLLELDSAILPPAGVIGGLVLTSGTDAPMPNRPVEIRDAGSGRVWTLATSAHGRFLQGGLPSGSYTIRVEGRGTPYMSAFYRTASGPTDPAQIDLQPGDSRDDFEIRLSVGGVISGHIRNDDSSPIEGATIQAIVVESGDRYYALTDEYGFYEMIGLPSGNYLIYAPILNRYYPDEIDPSSARAISVVAPAIVGRINLSGSVSDGCRIPPGSQGYIHGIVHRDVSGLTRGIIQAVSDNDTLSVEIDGPGVYLLACLPRAFYRVGLYTDDDLAPRYYKDTSTFRDAMLLSVTPPDTTWGVDFRPEASVKISGIVQNPDGLPIQGARVRAEEPWMRLRAAGMTDESGRFLLTRLGNQGEEGMRGGLPAGSWRVVAESTLVPDPIVTPVMQPTLLVELLLGGDVAVSWSVAPEFSWYCYLYRTQDSADEWSLIHESASGAGEDDGGGRYLDSPPRAGLYRYRLDAWVQTGHGRPPDPDGSWSAWSEPVWVVPELIFGSGVRALRLSPNPWDARRVLSLRLDHAVPADGILQLVSVAGRIVMEIAWPADTSSMELRLPDGVRLAAGVHFVRLLSGDREPAATATLLLVR